jgi:protocatechuate 3,4-dioxygenase alpha subunit
LTTPSQTVGPFFGIGLPFKTGPFAVADDEPGAIRIGGTVYDGDGDPVPDALVETWQTEPRELFARASCELRGGTYGIVTLKPAGGEAPWIDVSVFARGLLHRVVTRIHFSADDVLDDVPAGRRETLIAVPEGDERYRFDIRLQGSGETVFFDV